MKKLLPFSHFVESTIVRHLDRLEGSAAPKFDISKKENATQYRAPLNKRGKVVVHFGTDGPFSGNHDVDWSFEAHSGRSTDTRKMAQEYNKDDHKKAINTVLHAVRTHLDLNPHVHELTFSGSTEAHDRIYKKLGQHIEKTDPSLKYHYQDGLHTISRKA